MFRIGKWVAILGVVAAAAAPAWAQTGGISGKCTRADDTPCVKCIIELDRLGVKGHYQTKTDKHGNYVYIGLPIDNYKVSLKDPDGKLLYSFNGVHIGLGDPTPEDFDLKKLRAEDAKAQEANPEFQKRMEEQQKQEKQQAGLKQLFDQGRALMAQQKYTEAAATFVQAETLAKDKNLLTVLENEADAYAKGKEYDKAVATYQRAIAIDPTMADLHVNLGSAYAESGKIPEAQAEFEKAAQLDPANASRAYFNLGAVLYNSGKTDEAAEAFKKATQADPKYADAYYLEAQALMGKATMSADGKVQPAPGTVEALQTYLQLDPQGKYAANAQQMLQSLQGSVQTQFKASKKKKKE